MRHLKRKLCLFFFALALVSVAIVGPFPSQQEAQQGWITDAYALSPYRGVSETAVATSTNIVTILTSASMRNEHRGMVFFVYSDVAGSATIDYEQPNGTFRLLQTTAVSATTLTVIDFDFHLARGRLRFTTTSGTGVVDAEGLSY